MNQMKQSIQKKKKARLYFLKSKDGKLKCEAETNYKEKFSRYNSYIKNSVDGVNCRVIQLENKTKQNKPRTYGIFFKIEVNRYEKKKKKLIDMRDKSQYMTTSYYLCSRK